ncbi:hypothetical protein ACKGJI_06695 [Sulfurospirillum sp. 1307]|jgi:arsenate reductase
MKRVLLLSAGSPCRAIMAEGLLKKYINENNNIENIKFIGAGLESHDNINKNALKILKEEGINFSELKPRIIDDIVEEDFDLILTICSHSKEICPHFPKEISTIHMEFPIIDEENESTCKELAKRLKTKALPMILKSV